MAIIYWQGKQMTKNNATNTNGSKIKYAFVIKQDWVWSGNWLQDIAGDRPEDDHGSVDEVLGGGAAVLLSAESGEDEEDGQPDDQSTAAAK